MKRTVWTFGLISGAVLSAMMLLTIPFESRIGYDRALVIGYATMILSFLLVFFGIKSYRDNVGGGTVSFGRALAIGGLIVLISSVCYVVTWEFIYFNLMPDFAERYAAYSVEKLQRNGASAAEVQRQIVQMHQFVEQYKNPLYNSAVTFLEPLPVGAVIALVSAAVLRRKRNKSTSYALA